MKFCRVYNLIVFECWNDFFQASSRTILGKKAYACLKKGKEISDQILVDIMIDAIRYFLYK